MNRVIIAAAIVIVSVSAFGETHVTKAFSLNITPEMYRQDPAIIPSINKPGANPVVIGNKAFDALKKGGPVEAGKPGCWITISMTDDIVKFENTPKCLKSCDDGVRSSLVNVKVHNYQSSFINMYQRNCLLVELVVDESNKLVYMTTISIPTVNGAVFLRSYSTEKSAGTIFRNLVLSSLTINAPEPESIPSAPEPIIPNSALSFSARMGQLVRILIPIIIVLAIVSKIRNRT